MGIELGWANSYNVPIVVILKSGTIVKDSLKLIAKEIIEYRDEEDLIDKLNDLNNQK